MIVDVNVSLSRWPFRKLPCDETPKLIDRLKTGGVTQAWVGSFDGLLHRDIGGVNARLADECNTVGGGLFVPFGSVNPKLPDWREDVRRVAEDYRMPGIRLHPGYHGYSLDDPVFAELLTLADERKLIVELALRMEDPRTHHPLMPVPDVAPGPLADLVAARPGLRLVLLNALQTVRGPALNRLIEAGNVCFEIATLEGVGGILNLLASVPAERVLFGSHFPLFNLESALLKLRESELSSSQTEAVTHENAERLLRS
ncbi:MAG: amidohydrolase family protein [Planctomycetota bacterium]